MAIQPMGPSQFQLLDPLSALLYMLLIGEKGYEKSLLQRLVSIRSLSQWQTELYYFYKRLHTSQCNINFYCICMVV